MPFETGLTTHIFFFDGPVSSMLQVYFLSSLWFVLMLVLPSLARNLSSLVPLRASLLAQTKKNPSAMQET